MHTLSLIMRKRQDKPKFKDILQITGVSFSKVSGHESREWRTGNFPGSAVATTELSVRGLGFAPGSGN